MGLRGNHFQITPARIGGKQHPVRRNRFPSRTSDFIELRLHPDRRARMGQAGNDTHQHGKFFPLRQFVCIFHHVIRLLLRRRFEDRHHGKLAIEARILLVLRRMHRRVIRRQHHDSSVNTRNCRIDKRIGAYIHTYMLHTDQCPLAHVRHTQSRFHSGLLIRAPAAVQASRPC